MEMLQLTPSQLEIFDFVHGVSPTAMSSQDVEDILIDLRPCLGSALMIGGMLFFITDTNATREQLTCSTRAKTK